MSDTTARDRLAQIIERALRDMWDDTTEYAKDVADAILKAGFRPPARTVTTVEELDALAEGTVIRDSEGTVAENGDGAWHSTDGDRYWHEILALPATVLYEPKEGE